MLPFSCNIWELDRPPCPGYVSTVTHWRHWIPIFNLIYEEQKSAITCVSFGVVYGPWGVHETGSTGVDARILASLKGLKVVVRRDRLLEDFSWDFVEFFARERGCKIVQEERPALSRVYGKNSPRWQVQCVAGTFR